VYYRVMNTPSKIVSPSTILLQPHVLKDFLSQILISVNFQVMFGIQVVCHYAGAIIVVVWHCIGA